MALKVVFFFQQQAQGWTETWYQPGSSVPLTLPSSADAVAKASIKMRAAGTSITYIRYSLVGTRTSNLFRMGYDYVAPSGTQATVGEDVVSTSLLVKFFDSQLHKRFLWLRGLRDADVTRDASGLSTPAGSLLSQLGAYTAALINGSFQIRWIEQPSVFPALPKLTITTISPNTLSPESVSDIHTQTAPPGTWVAGQTIVRIIGVPADQCPGIPRTTVIKTAALGSGTGFQISYKLRNQGIVSPAKGYAFEVVYQYTTPTNSEWQYFGEHRTGRPFGVPRGRKSAAIRAQ